MAAVTGAEILSACGLDVGRWSAPFSEAVLLGALLHDIGKANSQFQAMVHLATRRQQALYHESVGLWVVASCPALNDWVFDGVEADVRWAVLRAIAGHHLRFDPGSSFEPISSGSSNLTVFLGHPDFTSALEHIRARRGLEVRPPQLSDISISLESFQPDAVRTLLLNGDRWWSAAENDVRRFAAAVAATVVAADVCGSARWRSGEADTWAAETLERRVDERRFIAAADKRLGSRPIRPFQAEVAASRSRLTLVTAGCGSGKTDAAYRWAGNRLAGRRLYFCYPTTNTAFEGFNDYVFEEFEHDAALLTSRAAVDIELLSNGDSDGMQAYETITQKALEAWGVECTVCTADTVLGLIQNHRFGLFTFPALCRAGYVFDEIHLYDDRLFGSLLAFLEILRGVPVLLMTATLQPGRLAAIRALAASLGEAVTEVGGPAELEELPRYLLDSTDRVTAKLAVSDCIAGGGHALWVTNTVDGARKTVGELASMGLAVEPYHSRYRYGDRLERHRAVAKLLRPGSPPGVAVTTQVCEVSLDVSADLLVTEVAPIPSVIQRLGRLNRRARPESGEGPKPALVLEPLSVRPYEKSSLDLTRRWLEKTAGRPTSQADLAAGFRELLSNERQASRTRSSWADEGWAVQQSALREEGQTATFIRAKDVSSAVSALGRPITKEVIRNSIPMLVEPVRKEIGSWRRLGPALVIPEGRMQYDSRLGATW